MDGTPSIPPDWYDDPAGSGGQRWWDGAAWSDHQRPAPAPAFPVFPQAQPIQQAQPVQQAQLVQQAQPVQQAVQVYQPTQPAYPTQQGVQVYQPTQPAYPTQQATYSPFQGHVSPGTSAWQAETLPNAVVVNNSGGWVSLGFGLLGLGVVVVSSMLGQTVYVLYFPLIVAIGTGIRTLAQHSSGRTTTIVPPILGILLGVTAGLLFLSVAVTGNFPGIQPSNAMDARSASEQFPDSPELATMYVLAYDIRAGIHDQYPNGNFPDEVTADESGAIELNGQTLGTLAEGQRFAYHLLTTDTFTFTIFGTVTAESMVYDSDEDRVTVVCYADDAACPDTLTP